MTAQTEAQFITAADVMPAEPKEGYRGYYPCPSAKAEQTDGWSDWSKLPLPLRAVTIHDPKVEYVVAYLYLGSSGRRVKALFRPEEYIRHQFCAYSPENPGTDQSNIMVQWRDGSQTFAKWYQDVQTGAYQVQVGAGGGRAVITQGGYGPYQRKHLPAGIFRDPSQGGKWQMNTTGGVRVSLA